MRPWPWLCLACLLAVRLVSHADTVEFWRGEPLEEVRIVKIEDGVLTFEHEGQVRQCKLLEVKTIRQEEPAPPAARVLLWREHQLDAKPGRLLGIGLQDQRTRLPEPLVRVYTLTEDDRGVRQVTLYQNQKNSLRDPTMVGELPEVNAADYAARYYFIPGKEWIAWRIEVWVDGRLATSRRHQREELPAGWWRTATKLRIVSLTPTTLPAAKEKDEVELPVTCTINRVSMAPELGEKSRARLSVNYTLSSTRVDEAPLPAVVLHYATENRAGTRGTGRITCEPDAGKTMRLPRGSLTRTYEGELPANLVLNSTDLDLGSTQKDRGAKIIWWRVIARYKDNVIATKEGGDTTAKKDLPDDWWK